MMKKTVKIWQCVVIVMVLVTTVMQVMGQTGPRGPRWPRYCTVQKKYNLTKRVKYRAPTAVRTYEWCFNFPPRCSKWTTEMRELTRLESEERVGEVEVCCPGFKYGPTGECEAFCEPGKTGQNCDEDCQPRYYGPSCSQYCDTRQCTRGSCERTNGACVCEPGWEGQRCNVSVTTTSTTTTSTTTTTTPATTSTTNARRVTTQPTVVHTKPVVTSSVVVTESTSGSRGDTEEIRHPTETRKAVNEKPIVMIENTTLSSTKTSPLPTYRTVIENITRKHIADNSNLISKKIIVSEMPSNSFDETTIFKRTETYFTTSIPKTNDAVSTITTKSIKAEPILHESISTKSLTEPSKSFFTTKFSEEITNSKTIITSETTRKPISTHKHQTTTKFKPKEIWIRPAQKGESSIVDLRIKTTQDFPYKYVKTSKELPLENSTTKTIIVSIIPTSVSAFKKIALSTASYLSTKANKTILAKSLTNGFTKPMTSQTITPFSIKPSLTTLNITKNEPLLIRNISKSGSVMAIPSFTTNSMGPSTEAILRLNSSNTITTASISSNISKSSETPTVKTTQMMTVATSTSRIEPVVDRYESVHSATTVKDNTTFIEKTTANPISTKSIESAQDETNMKNVTNISTNPVTDIKRAETFDILTEPEHITAVMSDNGTSTSSMDLVSVITIAGGVMMAVITVAVVIVMLERCRKPRYDEVRKFNDVSMNVIIDNHDVPPPPYVRSIFHTPLPEPPRSEKCHYQPISTLDRNLKQFMRPVVVQTISPIMLENFRGILECHYDHLPRRNHELHVINPTTPSVEECCKLLPQQSPSATDLAIEALKCEATMDVIDSTTSEPLYAEIPCWRPPSEHAVEVVNIVNGEAVTEL